MTLAADCHVPNSGYQHAQTGYEKASPVLGLLFGQPDRSFFASELIDKGAGSGAVQRDLTEIHGLKRD